VKKSILIGIIFCLFLKFPAGSDASYLILLKNGGRLVTPMHWATGKQIKFYIYGGVAGVGKEEIERIESRRKETDDYMDTTLENIGKKVLPPSSSVTEKAPGPEKRPAGVEQKPSMSDAPKIDKKEDPKKDPNLMQEFNKLEKKFESRKSMTLDELKDLWNELTAFWTKVRLNRLNEIFKDEVTEIFNMRDALDEILK